MNPDQMVKLLPEIYQAEFGKGGILDAVLQAQHSLHAPCTAVLDAYPSYFSAYGAPLAFVYMLAHWVDLDYLLEGPAGAHTFAPGDGRLRALIDVATLNIKRRGSQQALLCLLQTATGLTGFAVEANPNQPYRVTVHAPAAARLYDSMLHKIIARESPAFVHCTLCYAATEPSPSYLTAQAGA